MSDEAESSLGERLLQAVRNPWQEVNGQSKVLDHHGQEIGALKARMLTLERQVHGLKSSNGRALANNARLKASMTEAEDKLRQIGNSLN